MTSTSTAWIQHNRLGGLRRFATAITILNILGHTVLGFEQSWATPLVSLAAAYSTEALLELVDAYFGRRAPRFLGGPMKFIDFFLSAHITGLAVGMLIYTNARLWPVAFASAAAIASKSVFRAPAPHGSSHFMNPSNFGISLTLLLFSWVGIAPPYHFTEGLDRIGDWALPAVIVTTGTLMNWRLTKRLPLVMAWVGTFAAQALLRHFLLGSLLEPALGPMTGTAFILFTFYMVTDPATTPSDRRAQVLFGASTALVYGGLMSLHIVFGLFFSLSLVCSVRGVMLWASARARAAREAVSEGLGEAAVMAVAPR